MAATATKTKGVKGIDDDEDIIAKSSLRRYDVLLGRSKRSAMHIGNVAFRAFIDSRLEAYTGAISRSAKIHVVVSLTNDVYKAGGRFLDPKGNELWVKVDRSFARKKVGNSMRDAIKLVNQGRQRQMTIELVRVTENTTFAEIVDQIYERCDQTELPQNMRQPGPTIITLSKSMERESQEKKGQGEKNKLDDSKPATVLANGKLPKAKPPPSAAAALLKNPPEDEIDQDNSAYVYNALQRGVAVGGSPSRNSSNDDGLPPKATDSSSDGSIRDDGSNADGAQRCERQHHQQDEPSAEGATCMFTSI